MLGKEWNLIASVESINEQFHCFSLWTGRWIGFPGINMIFYTWILKLCCFFLHRIIRVHHRITSNDIAVAYKLMHETSLWAFYLLLRSPNSLKSASFPLLKISKVVMMRKSYRSTRRDVVETIPSILKICWSMFGLSEIDVCRYSTNGYRNLRYAEMKGSFEGWHFKMKGCITADVWLHNSIYLNDLGRFVYRSL